MTTITERRAMWARLGRVADSLTSKFRTRTEAFAEAVRQHPDLLHGALSPDRAAVTRKPPAAGKRKAKQKGPDRYEMTRDRRIANALLRPFNLAGDDHPVKPAAKATQAKPADTRADAVRRYLILKFGGHI